MLGPASAVPSAVPEAVPDAVSEAVPEAVPDAVSEAVPEAVPELAAVGAGLAGPVGGAGPPGGASPEPEPPASSSSGDCHSHGWVVHASSDGVEYVSSEISS